MTDLEDLLRVTLRDHARPVEVPQDLLPTARWQIAARRRTRNRALMAVSAAGSMIMVAAALTTFISTGRPVTAPAAPRPALARPPVPAGWRLDSALGVEFIVPAGWIERDGGCPAPQGNVMRGGGFGALAADCVSGSAVASKSPVARIMGLSPQVPGMLQQLGVDLPPGHPSTISGLPAEQGQGRTPDGRFTGWVKIPARGVLFTVQTPDPTVGRRVLSSLRPVDVDFNGCPTPRAAARPSPPQTSQFVPADTTAISACYYGDYQSDAPTARLLASARLTGPAIATLTAAVNARGPLPPPAPNCAMEQPQHPDIVLLFHEPNGRIQTIATTSNDCTGLRLDNARQTKQISRALAKRLLQPLHTQYGPDPELTG
jgi:hypothetical protein